MRMKKAIFLVLSLIMAVAIIIPVSANENLEYIQADAVCCDGVHAEFLDGDGFIGFEPYCVHMNVYTVRELFYLYSDTSICKLCGGTYYIEYYLEVVTTYCRNCNVQLATSPAYIQVNYRCH